MSKRREDHTETFYNTTYKIFGRNKYICKLQSSPLSNYIILRLSVMSLALFLNVQFTSFLDLINHLSILTNYQSIFSLILTLLFYLHLIHFISV